MAKTLQYSCKYGGACKIDMHMRKRCQACRLNKCYRSVKFIVNIVSIVVNTMVRLL